ncbi:MAG: alpha/beta hydrolase [Planctomycetia bacterium]|nr:alpha/beta hydrolase [Planctomycetia bacterium]
MLQTEKWNRQGLASEPIAYGSKIAHLPGYLARYFVIGNPDSPPLIVLSGLAGGMDISLPLASRLSQQFCVYVLQSRGEDSPYDLSVRTGMEQLGTDCIEFQKALGLERPLIFGHGFGAISALEAARQCPGRIAGIIAQGIAPSYSTLLNELLLQQVLQPAHQNASSENLFSLMFGTRWILPQLLELAVTLCRRTDIGVVSRRLELLSQFDIDHYIDRLRQVPLLIQSATHDVFGTPESWKPWRRMLPRMALQTIDFAGHFAFLTHGESVASQIERFASRRLGVPMQLPAV